MLFYAGGLGFVCFIRSFTTVFSSGKEFCVHEGMIGFATSSFGQLDATRYVVVMANLPSDDAVIINVPINFVEFVEGTENVRLPSKFSSCAELIELTPRERIGGVGTVPGKVKHLLCLACNSTYGPKYRHCPNDYVPLMVVTDEYTDLELCDENGEVYLILEPLAEGQCSIVLKAVRKRDQQAFVVKLEKEGNKQSKLVIKEEADALIELAAYDSVVKLIARSGSDASLSFFVMEYLDAPFLSSVIEEISLAETKRVIKAVAELLSDLHSKGLCHPGLTAGDINVGTDLIKLIDFGNARVIPHQNGTFSVNGIIGGDVSTIAPECLANKPVTAESNVYSLAAILFHCLAKKPVFQGKKGTAQQALAAMYNPAPRLSTMPKLDRISSVIDGFVSRCLSKNPEERPTMHEFVKTIEQMKV